MTTNQEANEIPYVFNKHPETCKQSTNSFLIKQIAGGMIINDKDASNTKLVIEIMKSLSKKILKLELLDMLKFSRPAKITSPITVLQCCSNEYVQTSLLDQAAASTDPIERIKYICAFLFSGIHYGPDVCKSKAPFNPIIGETYQGINSSGSKIFLEQTMHHPPTFNYDLVGKDNNYELMGFGAINAHLDGMNTIKGWREGKNILKFKDGTFISYNALTTRINGVMFGDRTYNYSGTLTIKDYTHKVECLAILQDELSEGIIQKMFAKKKTLQYDEFKIEIKQLNQQTKQKEVKCTGVGSWLGQVVFDNKVYWSIFDKKDEWKQDSLNLIPSDSKFRTDLNAVLSNDIDKAQVEKVKLENLQRTDQKLRDDYTAKHKK